MRYYTHIAGALLLYVTFAYLTDYSNLFFGIFFACWFSVFPDLMDKLTGKHRGYGHSIFWLVPFTLVGFLNLGIASAMIIGFISHIFLDVLTTHGCPLLYPLRTKDFVCFNKKRRIKTGTNQEKSALTFILFLVIPFLILALFTDIGYWNNPPEQSLAFASPSNAISDPLNSNAVKNNFNLNFEVDDDTNKNITVKKVDENTTTISITDV